MPAKGLWFGLYILQRQQPQVAENAYILPTLVTWIWPGMYDKGVH